jgi:hypothetical protein
MDWLLAVIVAAFCVPIVILAGAVVHYWREGRREAARVDVADRVDFGQQGNPRARP